MLHANLFNKGEKLQRKVLKVKQKRMIERERDRNMRFETGKKRYTKKDKEHDGGTKKEMNKER